MSEKTQPWWEIGVGAVTIIVCAALYWDSLSLPDPVFDPLGSVVVPRVTCAILAAFALAILIQGAVRLRRDPGGKTDEEPMAYLPRPGLAAGIFVLTTAYVLLLSTRLIRFSELSFAFLLITGLLITRFRKRAIPILLVLAALMGYGGQYVFTKVFYVDLP